MPYKTPKKGNTTLKTRLPDSPKTPGWVSGKDAIFASPKSSPKKTRTRRTTICQKMKPTSPGFIAPITQIISPKGVQTRSRRSSMFGVFKKGGVRLIDIPITPVSKKNSPPKTRTRRSSIYQKDVQQRTGRKTSVHQGSKDVSKPKPLPKQVVKKASIPVKPPRRRKNIKESSSETEVFINSTARKPVIHSPVVSLVDVVSPSKEKSQYITLNIKSSSTSPLTKVVSPLKSKAEIIQRTPSISKPSQGKRKLEKSVSDLGIDSPKTQTLSMKSPNRSPTQKVGSVKKSTRKTPARTTSAQALKPQDKTDTPQTATKESGIALNETEESMLITFKTPGLSVQKSRRKRKAADQMNPPAKKCILDLSPVEKLPFKTPQKLDKSPVLLLTRTPVADVYTSTPRDVSTRSAKTPLGPSVGRKNLKQSRQSLNRQKRVSIVSNLKTPDYNRPSLIDRRKATPAKTAIENHDESPSLTSLSSSHIKNSAEPLNATLLSSKSTNSVVTNSTVNTTSHSSAGRCTIL